MYNILVPVDGSSHSMKALQVACDLASKYGGWIALLHVLAKGKEADDLLGLGVADRFDAQLKAVLRKAANQDLGPAPGEVLRRVAVHVLEHAENKVTRAGLDVKCLPVAGGDPVEAILLAQAKIKANTIVMGSRGLAATQVSAFGSVSQRVFNLAPCTCLSVK